MLILTRKVGESVKINSDTTVTVIGLDKNQIRLGFDAPMDVTIHREEVYDRIEAERKAG